jgi:hypothetical protein
MKPEVMTTECQENSGLVVRLIHTASCTTVPQRYSNGRLLGGLKALFEEDRSKYCSQGNRCPH